MVMSPPKRGGTRWLLTRKQRNGGPSRSWAVAVIGDDVYVRFGDTDTSLPMHHIPPGTWVAPTALEEAVRRLSDQRRQGYEPLGLCDFDDEGIPLNVVINQGTEAVPVNLTATDTLNRFDADFVWSLTLSNPDNLGPLVKAATETLAVAGVEIKWVAKAGLPFRAPQIGRCLWTPPFAVQKARPGEQQGALNRTDGLDALWFILVMRRSAPDQSGVLEIFHKDAMPVAPEPHKDQRLFEAFGTTAQAHWPMLQALGLAPEKLVVLGGEAPDQTTADAWF
jgi:hypothetical protein